MSETATPGTGGTIRKGIQLDVTSPQTRLLGIEGALKGLKNLEFHLAAVNHLASGVSATLNGVNFANLGKSATFAAVQIGQITTAARQAGRASQEALSGAGRTRLPVAAGGGRQHYSGAAALTPVGMAHNAMTSVGWMLPMAGVFAGVGVAKYSVERATALERDTAILRQTFRRVGGSAQELTDDVLKLAAAEGRGSEEAMKAATHWTRLGLSRSQTAEATRVSLIAANVAEMTAHEATEKLSSVMATYNLNAYELNDTLGMLSRTSQTYRVTVGDLLDGLSRVSNVAAASGMSLAELQGIMGALVQRTGLSGERVANALQIFLNRVRNSGVQDFFESRFGMRLQGNWSDLGRISKLYATLNAEDRRQVALVTGTARQSNLFSGLMAEFPKTYEQAADSLRHLTAAEEENLKVTNTLSASHQRLITSWDRLVQGPVATRFASTQLDLLSGMIHGVTNTIGTQEVKEKYRYQNPSAASLWGVPLGFQRLLMHSMKYTPMYPGVKMMEKLVPEDLVWKSLGYSTKAETPEDKFQESLKPIMEHKRQASLHYELGQLADYYGRTKEAKEESRLMQEEEKTVAGMVQTRANELDLLLKAEKVDERRKMLAKNLQEILSLMPQKHLAEMDENEELRFAHLKKTAEELRLVTDDASRMTKGMGAPKWVEDVVGVNAQLRAATDFRTRLDTSSPFYSRDVEELSKRIRELQGQSKYYSGAASAAYSQMESSRNVATKMAGAEVEGKGVGYSEGERLLDRERWIAKELQSYGNMRVMNQADLARAMTLTGALANTELALQQRILTVEREKHQTMIETQREFQKTLITAGPGEILRKLALSQMTQRGKVGAGQFFSMAPEMRSDAYTLMGGEQMARLNWESRALAGQKLSVSAMQSVTWGGELRQAHLANQFSISADAAASIGSAMSKAAASALQIEAAITRAVQVATASLPGARTAPSAMPVPQSWH